MIAAALTDKRCYNHAFENDIGGIGKSLILDNLILDSDSTKV